MPDRLISRHPLDGLDKWLEMRSEPDEAPLTRDDIRFVAECEAVKIDGKSPLEKCVRVLAMLLSAHVDQVNEVVIRDLNSTHIYANPIELIQKESQKKDNREMRYTGNIAVTHNRIKEIDSKIVSEETPQQMMQWVFWCTLFGLGLLALGIYSVMTGGAVNLMTWVLESTWFLLLFTAVTIGVSLYFGFLSGGVLMVGGFLAVAWIVTKMPGTTSFILNGVLFLAAGILLMISISYIGEIAKYRPLSREEHLANQQRIAQRDALIKELNEYSDLMIGKLDIIQQKFEENEWQFRKEITNCIGGKESYNVYSAGAVLGFIDFLKKYYKKMRR
jgi:hypothetical protein